MSLRVETFQGLNNILEDQRCSIAKSCQAVEQCLEFNRDNLRGFFEQCFSLLLKQIFGYDGSSWLNSIAKGALEQDSKALVGLLSPNGTLMQAMQSADTDELIKFEFPLNRLPTHSQQLLRLEAGRAELERWPQYQKHIVVDGRSNCHVHLNVFEYFVFWTAFYVLRSSQVAGDFHAQSSPRGYGHLAPSLGTVRKALRVHRDRPHALRHPYLRLLQQYLEHFLPRSQQTKTLAPQHGFGSPARGRGSEAGRASRGRMLFSVLVEFWLTDGDEPVPLPPASQDLMAAWKTSNSLRVRSYQPPSEDLLEALIVLTRYTMAVGGEGRDSAPRPAQASHWLPTLPVDTSSQQGRTASYAPPKLGPHSSSASQGFSRRLYRFLYRALRFWPEQQPLTPVVHLWLTLAAPWGESVSDFRAWEGHILSNFPMYATLLPLFLDLLCTRVSTRGDAALSDLIKVLRMLKASPQLVELLRTVEADLARYASQAGRRPEGPHADVLPFLVDQSQDWESFATAGQALSFVQSADDVSSTSIFGAGQNSVASKTRDLLNAAAGAAKEELLTEAQGLARAVLPIDQLPSALSQAPQQNSRALKPIVSLRRGSWQELQYKGDWMRRPLSSSEVGWLVRLLLLVSDFLNRSLVLDQPVDADQTEQGLLKGVSVKLRKKGWRVNLRALGEKQTLASLPICAFFLWLIWKVMVLTVRGLLATGGG